MDFSDVQLEVSVFFEKFKFESDFKSVQLIICASLLFSILLYSDHEYFLALSEPAMTYLLFPAFVAVT